jgi:hypothetical protein
MGQGLRVRDGVGQGLGAGDEVGHDLLVGDVRGSFAYEMTVDGVRVLHPLESTQRDGFRRVGVPVAPRAGSGYVLEERLLHLAATADLPGLRTELARWNAWLSAQATDDQLTGPVAVAGPADVFVASDGPALLPTRWEPIEPVPLSTARARAVWEFAVELIVEGLSPATGSAAELTATLLGMIGIGDAELGDAVDLQVALETAEHGLSADEQRERRRELLTGTASVDVAGYRELAEAFWRQRSETSHALAMMEWTEKIIESRDYTLSKLDLEVQFYRSKLAGKALVLGRRAYQIARRDAGKLFRRRRQVDPNALR